MTQILHMLYFMYVAFNSHMLNGSMGQNSVPSTLTQRNSFDNLTVGLNNFLFNWAIIYLEIYVFIGCPLKHTKSFTKM